MAFGIAVERSAAGSSLSPGGGNISLPPSPLGFSPIPRRHRMFIGPKADPPLRCLFFQYFPFTTERLTTILGVKPGIAAFQERFVDCLAVDADDTDTATVFIDIQDIDGDIFSEDHRGSEFLRLLAKFLAGFRAIDSIQPDLVLLLVLQDGDRITVGDADNFSRYFAGRCLPGEENNEQEKTQCQTLFSQFEVDFHV